MTKDNWN